MNQSTFLTPVKIQSSPEGSPSAKKKKEKKNPS
jgi:hypothetical protein